MFRKEKKTVIFEIFQNKRGALYTLMINRQLLILN